MNPIPVLTIAHQGTTRGDPTQVICDQSKVKMPIPSPVLTPNKLFTIGFAGAIQQSHEKYDNAPNRNPAMSSTAYNKHSPGRKYHAIAPAPKNIKKRNLLIPPEDPSSSACKVFRFVVTTSTPGHIMLAGQTTNRLHKPANAKPVTWVVKSSKMLKPIPNGRA